MVAAALRLKPRLFLMENVPGMQSAKREDLSYLESAAKMLQDRTLLLTIDPLAELAQQQGQLRQRLTELAPPVPLDARGGSPADGLHCACSRTRPLVRGVDRLRMASNAPACAHAPRC